MIFKFLLSIIMSLFCVFAQAQTLSIITLSSAGSQSDTAARFFAPILEKRLNRNVIVINKPGAGGIIGTREFLQLPSDGNHILIGNSNLTYMTATNKNLGFDPIKELIPLFGLSHTPIVILVSSESSVNSITDLQKLYKSKGSLFGGVTYSPYEISMSEIDKQIGTKTTTVQYKQVGEMALNLASNMIDYTIAGIGNSGTQGLVDAGKLKQIAILGIENSNTYKHLPTMKALGYAPIEDFAWTGFFIRSDADVKIITELKRTLSDVMTSQEAKLYESLPGNPSRFLVSGERLKQILTNESASINTFQNK